MPAEVLRWRHVSFSFKNQPTAVEFSNIVEPMYMRAASRLHHGVEVNLGQEPRTVVAREWVSAPQNMLAAMLMASASTMVLNANDTTACPTTSLRIARVVTLTSDVCAVAAMVSEK